MKNLVRFILLIPLLGSCILVTEDAFIFDRETFERERQLWLEQDFQDYSFHFSFGDNNVAWDGTFIIKDGIIRYIREDQYRYIGSIYNRYIEPGPLLPAGEHNSRSYNDVWSDSISNIYARMEKFGNSEQKGRTEISVEYDGVYHYPVDLNISHVPAVQWPPPLLGGSNGYTISIKDLNLDPPELREEGAVFFDRETFDQERRLWLDQDFQNYSFFFAYFHDYLYKAKWAGTVVIKNGTLHSYSFKPYGLTVSVMPEAPTVPDDEVLAWIIPISGIYARIEEEAGKETSENIWADLKYSSKYHYPANLYYFRSSPHKDPAEDVCYIIAIGDINFDPPEAVEAD